MARIRRPKTINGSEYTFGGGTTSSTAAGGFVKIAKGSMNTNSADHDGFLSSGDTVTVKLDAGTDIPQKDKYIYFDNAFDTSTGTFTYEFMNGDSALPAGMSWSHSNDDEGSNLGYGGFNGTPSTEGTNSFKIKAFYNQGDTSEQVEITYTIKRFAAGTTPVWSNTTLPDRIIRNLAGDQVLAAGPTTTYADATYRLSNVSGFATGVVPTIDATTGQVVVTGVGDITQATSVHAFTVTADLGSEIGTFTQAFSGSISYGDPYGSRYFGPANAKQNITATVTYNEANSDLICTPLKSSGALKRVYDIVQDTSPYIYNDGYGCQPVNPLMNFVNTSYQETMSGHYAFGVMGHNPNGSAIWAGSSNHQTVTFTWTVPNGVTSICAVAVGGGSHGAYNWSADGGGGGGLAWMNNISVTAGETFLVGVGLGRQSEASTASHGAGSSYLIRSSNNKCIIFAQGGGWTGYTSSNPSGQSTAYTGGRTITGINSWTKTGYNFNNAADGGGFGHATDEGSPADDGTGSNYHYGGGAAGYSNSRVGGGAGGYRQNTGGHSSSTGGAGGGGGSGYSYSSTWGQGAGGGVGLDGQGYRGEQTDSTPRSSVAAGSGYGGYNGNRTSYAGPSSVNYYGGGGGGSGGSRGVYGENPFNGREENNAGNQSRAGGLHGGGGGGSGTSSGGGHGATGGVRIIWGVGADGTARSFPYTYCSEKQSMKYNGES